MRFRPCIDLHQGIVKQIIGSTLTDKPGESPLTNFESQKSSQWFARRYRRDNLTGGHIIQLGPGNKKAARQALAAWPGGMQLGGGVNITNAKQWLDAGAGAVIITSWVFHNGVIDYDRLKQITRAIGKKHLVLDLSCRRRADEYIIITDRWQTFSREVIAPGLLDKLSLFCDEFLIHAADVEGKCQGIETDLVKLLGQWSLIPITYAGGICSLEDIRLIKKLGAGHLDFTVGSALDIFGGTKLTYQEMVNKFSPRKY